MAAYQEKIEYARLRLNCALEVQTLLSFRTMEQPGEHGRGIFRVRLEPQESDAVIRSALKDSTVELQVQGAGKGTLFSGYLEEVRITSEGGVREAEITALSGTVCLDRRKRGRVFQDPAQKYGDVVRRVTGAAGCACILSAADRKAGQPYFQYRETDWEFVKRVAAGAGLPVVADNGIPRPRLYIGMRKGDLQELPEGSWVSSGFDGERYYRLSGKDPAVARRDFFCYHVTTWKDMDLGDRMVLEGREVSIHRKEAELRDGVVEFRYRLAGEGYSRPERKIQEELIGIEMSGTVEGTEGETCTLALDLEKGQPAGWSYPYAPLTGNLMYCMPRDKTSVQLNLGNGEEKEARAVCSLRGNGEDCEGTETPAQRSFHTDYGKGLELYPESLTLSGKGSGSLGLDVSIGASITSSGMLTLNAKGTVRLEGGLEISLEAATEIYASTMQMMSSSLWLNQRIDLLAAGAVMKGTWYEGFPEFEDAPQEGHFDWLGFTRNLAMGLLVAAALFVGAIIFAGAFLGAVFLGAAIGALMVTISMSKEDFDSGNVRSYEEATRDVGIGAVVGAFMGACGGLCEMAGFGLLSSSLIMGGAGVEAGIFDRGVHALYMDDLTYEKWQKETFNPLAMVADFGTAFFFTLALGGLQRLFTKLSMGQRLKFMSKWNEEDINAFNRLSPREQQVYLTAIENESQITLELQERVQRNGGYLEGLENRIKTPSSLYEKIYTRPDSTPITDINDIIRYTEIQNADELIQLTQSTLRELEARGYEVIQIKNFWLNDMEPYNGINIQLRSPNGQTFELQSHTLESYTLKNSQLMHGLYERIRMMESKDAGYMQILDRMFDLFDSLEMPKNIDLLQNIGGK